MKNELIVSDSKYHAKQRNPEMSKVEELRAIYQSAAPSIADETTAMVNKLPERELYYLLNEKKKFYEDNYDRFTDGITVDKYAVDRDPLLSKLQKSFEAQFLSNAVSKDPQFMKNSYTGYGASAHFMIRALSYIYPMLIIKPLPTLTWREDWPVFAGTPWSNFDVFLTGERIANPTVIAEQSNESGRVQAQFGESIFQNITIRQDIIWDSTVEMYADQSMNNGLVSYLFMESLKRGFDQKINEIYLFGETGYGLPGLLNNSNIATVTSGGSWNAINSATGEKWATTDLINLCSAVEQNSNGVFTAKKIMMSLALKPYVIQPRSAYVSTSPIGYVASQKFGNDFATMLDSARYNPYLNLQGTSSTQIAFAYDPKTEYAHIGLPQFMFAEPITYQNHKYNIPFITRTGGFRIIQSPSIVVMPSITTT